MHKCPAQNCRTTVGGAFLMCAPHWRMVPADVQREVYAGYREMKAGKSARRWVEAKDRAIEIVDGATI